jgi:hypothetical protein
MAQYTINTSPEREAKLTELVDRYNAQVSQQPITKAQAVQRTINVAIDREHSEQVAQDRESLRDEWNTAPADRRAAALAALRGTQAGPKAAPKASAKKTSKKV